MTVRIGPYEFTKFRFHPDGDSMALSIDGRWGTAIWDSPENDVWFVDFDDLDEIVAVELNDPRDRLRRDGAVFVTLPSGERVKAEGIEEAIAQLPDGSRAKRLRAAARAAAQGRRAAAG